MVKVKNMGVLELKEYIKNKDVYLWGAGKGLQNYIDVFGKEKTMTGIVDKNTKLWGAEIRCWDRGVKISDMPSFLLDVSSKKDRSIIIITSPIYAAQIIDEMNDMPELDGVECFIQELIRYTKEEIPSYEFTTGNAQIPKKIHYVWLGKKALPYEYEKNIETWRKYNPDYEILLWNENNYDIESNEYLKRRYDLGKYEDVSDYMRLDAVYKEGGIYLDTDVRVIRSFDSLLCDKAFFNMGSTDRVNLGCGFGGISGLPIHKEMRDEYERCNATKSPHIAIQPIIMKYGFVLENKCQKIDGITLYPTELMSPLTNAYMDDFMCEKTISIHEAANNWRSDKEKEEYKKIYTLIEKR